MNFFKQQRVVISIIFLGISLSAMEKVVEDLIESDYDQVYYLFANGTLCDDRSNCDRYDRYDSSNSDLFNTGRESLENNLREIDARHETHCDFAVDSWRENMRDAAFQNHDQQSLYESEKFQNQDLGQNDVHVQVAAMVHMPLIEATEELVNHLKSPTYRSNLISRIMSLKNEQQKQGVRDYLFSNTQRQIDFLDALQNGSIDQMLTTIQKGDLKEAQKAFNNLKNIWPWDHKASFLTSQYTSEPREFIEFIGIDIMQVAEGSLVSRKDYLESCDRSFADKLQHYQRVVLSKQLQGNETFLLQEVSILTGRILANQKSKTCSLEKAMLSTVKSILANPITDIFSTIRSADFDTGARALDNFQMQSLFHFEGQSYKTMEEARANLVERHGIDLLGAAKKCFESRADYRAKMEQSKLNEIQNATLNGHIANTDSFDLVSTTVSNCDAIITQETNQCIVELLDTLISDQQLESFSNQIDILTENLQGQELSQGVYNKSLVVGLESYIILEQYLEKPNKRIVIDLDKQATLFDARKQALKEVSYNPTECSEQMYTLTPAMLDLLLSHHINPDQFAYCFGNKVQQQLHNEFVTILNESALIPSNENTQPLLDMITTCSYVGNVYAQENDIAKVFSFADSAWASLDFAKEISNGLHSGIIDLAEGATQGLVNAVRNNVNMVLQPIDTVKSIATTFCHLTYCLGKFMEPIMIYDSESYVDEQTIEKVNAEWKENMQSVIDAATRITLKKSTALLTECIISPKITKLSFGLVSRYAKTPVAGLIKIVKETKDKIGDKTEKVISSARQKVVDKVKGITENNPVAVTPEGVVLNASEEACSLHNAMDKINISGKDLQPIGNAILKEGYYEVNGFKFTEYYYERLWNNGRNCPGFRAESILKGATSIMPDPQGYEGFFKYVCENWEMIFNPTTGVVSHLSKLKKS